MFIKIRNEFIRLDKVTVISVQPEVITFHFSVAGIHEIRLDDVGPQTFENIKLYLNNYIEQAF